MEVSNHYPAAVLMTIGFVLFTLATTGFVQVVMAMCAITWTLGVFAWTGYIALKAITSTNEPEGKALA